MTALEVVLMVLVAFCGFMLGWLHQRLAGLEKALAATTEEAARASDTAYHRLNLQGRIIRALARHVGIFIHVEKGVDGEDLPVSDKEIQA